MNRFARLALAVALAPLAIRAQSVPAFSDAVLRAMDDELKRSVAELRLNDLDRPYFIQYTVLDEDEYLIDGVFGAITQTSRNQARNVQVQVRVGSYDFDNTGFVAGGGQPGGGAPATGVLTTTVVDDDYDGIRHTLWLATDAAYKQAVEHLARKRAFVQNRLTEEPLPDFSREMPVSATAQRQGLNVNAAQWEKQIREWSAIFREFPEIQQSGVSLKARLTHRYIVNNEGTKTLQPSIVVSVEAGARVQAEDGMQIGYSIPFNARSFDQLPSTDAITAAIRQLASDLRALRAAPVLDADYSGPVLLTGRASSELFSRVLAPNLSGQRPPLTERNTGGGSELLDRINRPVLPPALSVVDDPTLERFGNQDLIGHYAIDDQGVSARPVSLVESGVFKDLLMSRSPGRNRPKSNGHGRSGIPGRESAQIGNLIVMATGGKSYEDLKNALIQLCKDENISYGIVVKSVDSDGRGPIGAPVMAYKVYVADGREELIRGASVNGFPVRSLRQIAAVGNDSIVDNRLVGPRNAATPVSIVAPSVLLTEMDIKRPTGTRQMPALLTPPTIKK